MSISLQAYPFVSMPIIASTSLWSLGGAAREFAASPASFAWGTANQARYVPFHIPNRITVVKLLAYNGTTAAGNTDIGIYRSDGSEVVGIAAAAQAGTSAWQEFNITDTTLLPGLYYVGLLNTTTTGTYLGWANLQWARMLGVFSEAVGAGTLPTPSATFAALDAAKVPVVGMATRTLI